MTEKVEITLHINGQPYCVRTEARKTLVDAIRDDCGQTGTHVGCEHGVCGACTVIVDGEAVRACLMFAVQADGKHIRTVEGLAAGDKLHPLQEAFMAHHALQCGFCTPGFLMLTVDALEKIRTYPTTRSSISLRLICAAAPGTRTSSRPCAARRARCAAAVRSKETL